MKKVILLVSLIFIIFSLSSCGKKDIKADKNADSSSMDIIVSNIKSNLNEVFELDSNEENSDNEYQATVKTGLLKNSADFYITDADGNTLITKSDIQAVGIGFDEINFYYLEIKFSEKGKENFRIATENNIGKTLNIYINGELLSSPTVNEVISTDRAIISGNMGREQVFDLYNKLTE